MAENKNKIIVYKDWLSNFEDLTDEELGKLMRHFFEYINDKSPILEDRILKIAWKPIETTLKRDLKKWEQFTNKQAINGKKGGRPKTQKTQPLNEKPKKAVSDSVSDSVNVSDSNKKESKEKKDIKNVNPPQIDFENIKNYYNKNRGNLPECKILSDKRKKAIKARAKEYGLESVKKMIDIVNSNDFLQGENRQGWTATFDWIFNKVNFIKIIEGNYKNKNQNEKSAPNTGNKTEPTIGRQSFEVIRKNSGGW